MHILICIRSDEWLTLETSALESLYGGQFTLSTHLIKPNSILIFILAIVIYAIDSVAILSLSASDL